jgi:hypothetical protein
MAGSALLAAGVALSCPARADLELTGPDGRRILLMDNRTWQYVESGDKDQAKDAKDKGEAVLRLERVVDHGPNCRFVLRLVNNLPYEIRSLVPYYSAYRSNGVIYDTVSSGSSFGTMKPGDTQAREIEFAGIRCREIVRVQVTGGDRCDMGELNKFSPPNGECLSRVRVVPSDLMRFDK